MRPGIVMIIVLLSLVLCPTSQLCAQTQQIEDSDLQGVVITLKQENHCGCINCCSEYSVSISGDGTVTYEGVAAVSVRGKQVYSIQLDQVKELVNEFFRVDYFSLKERYIAKDNGNGTFTTIDHAAPVTTSIKVKGRNKTVYDFYGAPEKLKELEKKIYELSGVGVYVRPT